MAYSRTTWVNGVAPAVDAANLNNIEQGILDVETTAGAAIPKAISGVATSKVPVYDGANWVASFPPGYEYAYNQITSSASITATSAGAANTVITASAIDPGGSTAVLFHFYAPYLQRGTANLNIHLWEDSTDLGQLMFVDIASGYGQAGGFHRKTPTAGSKTYSIRAYVDAGTGAVGAGSGVGNNPMPAFIRITKA